MIRDNAVTCRAQPCFWGEGKKIVELPMEQSLSCVNSSESKPMNQEQIA